MHSIFWSSTIERASLQKEYNQGKMVSIDSTWHSQPLYPLICWCQLPQGSHVPVFITAPLLTLNISWPLNTASCSAQPLPVVTSGLELRQQLASLASAQAQCYCPLAQYLALASNLPRQKETIGQKAWQPADEMYTVFQGRAKFLCMLYAVQKSR